MRSNSGTDGSRANLRDPTLSDRHPSCDGGARRAATSQMGSGSREESKHGAGQAR